MPRVKPNLELDKDFSKLINGKDVVIVGPASYLEGSGYGAAIDEKEVVVRINRSIETTKTHSKDVGNRTDILYSCLLETHRNGGILDFDFINKSGVKMICAPGFNQPNYATHSSISDKTWEKISNSGFSIRVASKKVDDWLKSRTQTRPNTGFIAIFDILSFKPKSLTIHGFTFYLDGFIKGSKSGVETEKNCTEEEFALMALKSQRHNQENIWKFAKEALSNNPMVVLDSTMKKILSLENFSREEYQNYE